jgi:hypothetical protein
MNLRTLCIVGLSLAAWGIMFAAYRVHCRMQRVRREIARLRYNRALATAYDLERVAEEHVWGIG